MHRHAIVPVMLVFAALLAGGCYETGSTYTVNPDGTGKVHLEARFTPMMIAMGTDRKDPESKARKAARDLMKNAKGIEVWKDVTAKVGEDGRTVFSGTGYFRDVSRVKFQNLGENVIDIHREENSLTFTVNMGREKKEEAASARKEMTGEEIAAAIKKQRTEYRAAKPMVAGIFASMKSESTFILPGTLQRSANLRKLDDGSLSVGFDGPKLLAAFDKTMADDAYVRECVVTGRKTMKDGPGDVLAFNEALFGEKAPIEAVLEGPFEPLFDYAVEVEAARKAYPAVAKALNIRDVALVEPVKPGEGLKKVSVGGIRYVGDVEEKTGLRPFNHPAGYSVCVIAEFDGAIVNLDEALVERVVADTGADLMPEREWERKANFPDLSDDRTAAAFTFKLAPLPKGARGIKELCGIVRYRCAGTTRKADVGITRFETGVKGTEFGATIKSVKPSEWVDGGTTLKLQLELDKDSIKSVTFFDKDDFEIEFDGTGSSSWGEEKCSFEYTTKGKFPTEGRIVLEVYEAQRKHEVPFTIENVDLFGNPRQL